MGAALAVVRQPSSDAITVECIESTSAFAALRGQWNALLHASTSDNPFLTWEWLYSWWTCLSGTSQLRIAAVRSGGELIGLAPFYSSSGRLPLLARFDFLGSGHAGSDYLDVIAQRDREPEIVDAIAGFLRSHNRTVRLPHLESHAVAFRLARNLTEGGWASTITPDGVCPYIKLAGHTWDSYLATIGAAHRANVRRRLKALGRDGALRFELVRTDTARREALAVMAAFHERRYAERGGSTAFMNRNLVAFHDEASRQALASGWLRLFTLSIGDAVAAVMYGFMYKRRFYFYQHGFDDHYRQHSLGLVLMALSIRSAIDEGADEFDMLWGAEPYKFLWARETRPLRRIQLFPPHVGGRLHRTTFHARRTLGSVARRARSLVRRGAHGA